MSNQSSEVSGDYELLTSLWQVHQSVEWPVVGSPHEGELMTLDTVIAGCVTYFFEERSLDAQRIEILKDSLNDLDVLLPELEGEPHGYFERVQQLGQLLLKLSPIV